jgi:hypothetical protein
MSSSKRDRETDVTWWEAKHDQNIDRGMGDGRLLGCRVRQQQQQRQRKRRVPVQRTVVPRRQSTVAARTTNQRRLQPVCAESLLQPGAMCFIGLLGLLFLFLRLRPGRLQLLRGLPAETHGELQQLRQYDLRL